MTAPPHLDLLEELRARAPKLSFSLGCDFHLSYENIEDAMNHPERYTIGDTRYLLVELSEYSAFNAAQTLHSLADRRTDSDSHASGAKSGDSGQSGFA